MGVGVGVHVAVGVSVGVAVGAAAAGDTEELSVGFVLLSSFPHPTKTKTHNKKASKSMPARLFKKLLFVLHILL